MGTRDDNRRAMEQRLYDAALTLFCELGYKQTTLSDIAAEAGTSTRTLYNYFPTKESILRKFSRENIVELKSFTSSLPADMPLKEKVLETMVQDYKLMFGLFDVSYILHTARDESGVFNRFELENVMIAESLYCTIFKHAQLKHGVEPNDMVALCASVVLGLYRNCTDLYRFRKKGVLDEKDLRQFYLSHLDVVWDSLEKSLLSQPAGLSKLFSADRHLFGSF